MENESLLGRNVAGRNRNRNGRTAGANGQRGNRTIFRNRDSGFFMHYAFITLSMRYASFFKPTARRLIEFFTLLKAIFMLSLMIYIHTTFVKESGNCLDDIENIWPKHGVLKVQVEANTSLPPYQFFFAKTNPETWATSFQMDPYQAVLKYSIKVGRDGIAKFKRSPPMSPNIMKKSALEHVFGVKIHQQSPVIKYSQFQTDAIRNLFAKKFSEITPEIDFLSPTKEEDIPRWVLINPSISDTVAEIRMLQMQEVNKFSVGPQPVREYYAIEYSTEFGYLRLPAVTRYKLGIPVMVVTLDPERDQCFGTGLKHWMLETFFGYDDLVMGSIKNLAEKSNKDGGGFLRNLVTGEHFKFITLWVGHTSYILAFTVMLLFTLIVTMLLRYSYHQIFLFMVEVVHVLDTDTPVVFPAAPMLTIILALVGTEEIMTEFFHDSTLAFYVILSIWIADQFDVICMHTVIGRRHWVRFFFLYHFAFYAYHYRYNGQFSELALFTSWLFIQHSMFYFLHHYEIPAIQRRIRFSQVLLRNTNSQNLPPDPHQPGPNEQPPPASPETGPTQEGDDRNEPSNSAQGGQTDNTNSTNNTEPESGSISSTTVQNETVTVVDSNRLKSIISTEPSTVDLDIMKRIDEIELWEEYPTVLTEGSTVSNTERLSKYCNLIVMLLLSISAIVLIFTLSIVTLNLGKIGAKFGGYRIEKVGDLVS